MAFLNGDSRRRRLSTFLTQRPDLIRANVSLGVGKLIIDTIDRTFEKGLMSSCVTAVSAEFEEQELFTEGDSFLRS